MRWKRSNGGIVIAKPAVVATLKRYQQNNDRKPEAGGIILGRFFVDSDDILLEVATEPDKTDRRKRHFFSRAREPAQRKVDDAWLTSTGVVNYLGEWHTHPEDDPTPSTHDARDWRRISREAEYEQEYLLFIIVGRRIIRIWELRKGNTSAELLAPLF